MADRCSFLSYEVVDQILAQPNIAHMRESVLEDYKSSSTLEEIQEIVLTVNLTPRKCLGFKTPFQVILKELGKDVQIRFS